MKNNAKYLSERKVKVYIDLIHGAKVLFDKSLSNPEGSFYTDMSSILLSAFTFEAYLNYLGKEIIPFWDNIEKIKVLEKLDVICKQLNIEIDRSRRPFQTLNKLFKFRNPIAHGKSEIITVEKEVNITKYNNDLPKTKIEEFCTNDNARKCLEDVREIIKYIHKFFNSKAFYVIFYLDIISRRRL
jgi:hypothetical protein